MTAYEDSLCPLCGRPLSVCTSAEAEWYTKVPAPTRCHVTTAIDKAHEPYRQGKTSVPHALMFTATVGF